MRLLIFCLAVSCTVALKLQHKNPCDEKDCRAGRECLVLEGEAQCLCVVSCPDHFKPVCGDDGVSYDNHCRLHQKACISDNHISIKHKGYCKTSYDKLWRKKDVKKGLLSKEELEDELQNDLIKLLKKGEKKKKDELNKGPAVCYGPQRNALRYLIVEHFEDDVKKKSWYSDGMTYRESLWGWFFTCDGDQNNYITPEEFLSCAKNVNFFARPGQDNELTKELCIDALIDDGDRNKDWKLDFEEFTRIMDPKYEPKDKQCSLEGKKYLDGEEVHDNCNHCICAIGNWVCMPTECKGTKTYKKGHLHKTAGHSDEIDNDIDIPVENSNDVIDHVAVADLWMENNKKDKEKGKKAKKEEDFDVDDNLFLDFDLINDEKPKEVDNDGDDDEDKELQLDDYYDELYEKTKLKNGKKKVFQLEKTLKEVKTLRKKTAELEKLLKQKEKNSKKEPSLEPQKKIHKETKQHPRKETFKTEEDLKAKKYYDDVYRKTKWNDLIDWGGFQKLKTDKDFNGHNDLP